MIAAGYAPTSTTYTALISAYGKAAQLDKALGVFTKMACPSSLTKLDILSRAVYTSDVQMQQGCERNVITYSSLIAACEKAGRWQLALKLLEDMQRDHISPNTLTFNSLISACAQGEPHACVDVASSCSP